MVTVRSETRNQREEIVQILVAMLIVPRRPTVADATVMVRNLGLVDKNAQKAAKELIMSQANGRALVRSQHFLPYAEIQIKSFEDRVASPVVTS